MKKTLITMAAVVSISPAAAERTDKFQDTTSEHLKICASWGRFAELAMQAHQRGAPLTDQMALSPDPRAYELTVEAYQSQRFSTQSQQEIAASSFRDKISAECISALSSDNGTDLQRPAEFWLRG